MSARKQSFRPDAADPAKHNNFVAVLKEWRRPRTERVWWFSPAPQKSRDTVPTSEIFPEAAK